MPGLWTGLADAANRCMHRRYDDDAPVQPTAGGTEPELYRLLGITSAAAPKQVTCCRLCPVHHGTLSVLCRLPPNRV